MRVVESNAGRSGPYRPKKKTPTVHFIGRAIPLYWTAYARSYNEMEIETQSVHFIDVLYMVQTFVSLQGDAHT